MINAHIIPVAFWLLPPADQDAAKIISNRPGHYPRTTRKGVYDRDILCEECDGSLGRLDQHAAEALLNGCHSNLFQIGGNAIARTYDQGDPETLSKFIASVVWRASISTHDFFRRVSLGPYQEPIAHWLRGIGPSPIGVESVIAEFNDEHVPILDPHKTKTDGVNFWVIYANRFIFYLKADKRGMPKPLDATSLVKGRPVYSVVREWTSSKEYRLQLKLARSNPTAFRRAQT